MYFFTPQRFAELESMIAEAKEKADQAARSGHESGAEQDGHHDESYQLSLRQTATLDRLVMDLEEIKCNAEIVIPAEQDHCVQFGNGVELVYSSGEVERFVVEGYIFDFSNNRLSVHSPLGQAITGKRAGEKAQFNVGGRNVVVVIGRIFLPSQAEKYCSDHSGAAP